jgi:PAS domain S-box-containing protein
MLAHARTTEEPSSSRQRLDDDLVNAALRGPEAIVWVDRDGTIVLVNDACRALLGAVNVGSHITSSAETYGIEGPDGVLVQPLETPLARALYRRERLVDEPCRIRRPSGRVVELLVTARPLDDARGRSVGAMISLREAREPRTVARAENELERQERRFQALAGATAQAVWTSDTAGIIVSDSPSWRSFTGQTWEEFRGVGWLDALHEDDREHARAAWLAAIASRTGYEVEYRVRRHDGAFRWTLARGTPVLDASGEIVEWVGCNWDIHPIKEAEQDLERAVGFQQMLLAIVGHDLKNPLSSILVGAGILHADAATPAVRRTADRITRAALRANQIVGLLLDLAEVTLGKGLGLDRQETDIAELARDIVDELDASIPGRAIVLTSAGSIRACVDSARIGQVLSNLIGNALHHGRPGTPVRVALGAAEKAIEIAVQNAGEAIPAARMNMLFAPFAGADAPPSDRRNLGLGLYIVKMIVEAHGGQVDAESKEGLITFRVRLPR